MAKDLTVDYYRQCFQSEHGKRVLANMMLEAKFFDHTHTPEEQAVENFMKTILAKTGCYNKGNIDAYINNLMALPRKES
jgi:hypothetical protein